MMRKIIVASLLLLWINAAFSQEEKTFIFTNKIENAKSIEIDQAQLRKNALGNEIAQKAYIIKKTYTYIEKGSPTSPGDKTIVRKPTIYYNVQKLNKYYKKEIKKGNINESEAIDRYKVVLDNAYSIFDQNTDKFEDYLKSLKNPKDIEKAFLDIILD